MLLLATPPSHSLSCHSFSSRCLPGLALDFCVLDTCLNASSLGFRGVYMVLDAARAAHIPGVGSFGSGFLSDPAGVASKLEAAAVQVRQ